MNQQETALPADAHAAWMRRCLELAARGAGHVSPNPMVGAVLAGPEGALLGEGWHRRYGGAHAERHAVADVERHFGADAPSTLRRATLYVNLEPCSHYGKTPPCADLVLEKAIPRVVVGMIDPFAKVAGRGIARLREHGVDVRVGVLEQACRRLNEPFIHHVQTGRPLVTLKIAQTLDGQVATRTGDARWVSGAASRRLVHRWRAELDGVLVGSGTARADDPALTVRHLAGAEQAGDGRQPMRIVLDRAGTLPPHLQLFTDGFAAHTLAVTNPTAAPAYAEALHAAGGHVLRLPETSGHLDLEALLDRLGRDGGHRDGGRPMQSLLVEAGPGLATALVRRDLVDRLFLFIAPKLVGRGVPAFRALDVERMRDARAFTEHRWETVGEDLLFRGYLRAV